MMKRLLVASALRGRLLLTQDECKTLIDELIDEYSKDLVFYLLNGNYDKDNTPCVEYQEMADFLGLGVVDPDQSQNVCVNTIKNLLSDYEEVLLDYDGYNPTAID